MNLQEIQAQVCRRLEQSPVAPVIKALALTITVLKSAERLEQIQTLILDKLSDTKEETDKKALECFNACLKKAGINRGDDGMFNIPTPASGFDAAKPGIDEIIKDYLVDGKRLDRIFWSARAQALDQILEAPSNSLLPLQTGSYDPLNSQQIANVTKLACFIRDRLDQACLALSVAGLGSQPNRWDLLKSFPDLIKNQETPLTIIGVVMPFALQCVIHSSNSPVSASSPICGQYPELLFIKGVFSLVAASVLNKNFNIAANRWKELYDQNIYRTNPLAIAPQEHPATLRMARFLGERVFPSLASLSALSYLPIWAIGAYEIASGVFTPQAINSINSRKSYVFELGLAYIGWGVYAAYSFFKAKWQLQESLTKPAR